MGISYITLKSLSNQTDQQFLTINFFLNFIQYILQLVCSTEEISLCSFELHFRNGTNDVEHLFLYLLAICIASLEKYLLKSFRPFLNQIMCLLLLSCQSSEYILDIRYVICKHFSPFCGLDFFFFATFILFDFKIHRNIHFG